MKYKVVFIGRGTLRIIKEERKQKEFETFLLPNMGIKKRLTRKSVEKILEGIPCSDCGEMFEPFDQYITRTRLLGRLVVWYEI
jgi:predicted nucleic acid-binding OB-fold protein